MPMRYLIFPGQGSQKPGFLSSWIANKKFKATIEEHSEITGLDLLHLGTEATAEEIAQTVVTQPLIVSASIASVRTVFEDSQLAKFDGIAGHSVGEFAAAAIAGVITDREALELVSLRAKAMQEAATKTETGMAAAIGADVSQLEQKLGDLVIANYNGANQYVVAGLKADLQLLLDNPPAGFRIIPLSVSGAFHTAFMEPAKDKLKNDFEQIQAKDPKVRLLSNKDGQPVSSGAEFLETLLTQVSSPVRWDKCMQTINGSSLVVEAAPSGVLSNLLKKTIENADIYSLKSPNDSIDLGTND